MPSIVQNALLKLTGLDQVLSQEFARRAQIGGLQPSALSPFGDEATAELVLIEDALSQFNMLTRMHRDRVLRYRDYDAMDNYGDISVALDIYAEEATQTDLVKKTSLWFTGDDQIVEILDEFAKTIRLHTMLFGFARQLAKYGDMFVRPKYNQDGLNALLYLPPDKIRRVGPSLDQVRNFALDHELGALSPRKDSTLLPWECVHFRIISFGFSTLYGRSIIEAARKRWLHLKLLEDGVAIYRLNRAVERLIYYVDVGQTSPTEALRMVASYKRKFGNKRNYINPGTNEVEQQYDPTNMMENIFWPVNSATERSRIEKLDPPPDQGQLQDLVHFNEKLYIALGIPKDYLTGEVTGTWNSREALSLQDVRFSRKIHRIQVAIKEGIETLCRMHLAIVLKDAELAKSADFRVNMADVSKIAQSQYDTILLNRAQLLTSLDAMGQQLKLRREQWVHFILSNFFPDINPELLDELVIPDEEIENKEAEQQLMAMGQQYPDQQMQQQQVQNQQDTQQQQMDFQQKQARQQNQLQAKSLTMKQAAGANANKKKAKPNKKKTRVEALNEVIADLKGRLNEEDTVSSAPPEVNIPVSILEEVINSVKKR